MNAQEILKYLEEKHGWKEATADHPIYSAPPTIRFINRSGANPPRQKNALGKEKRRNSFKNYTENNGEVNEHG
jgi:hypothetical protein